MILHNYVFVVGSTNPGCCFSWCFRRFCHVVGYLDFRLLRFCLSTANRNWSWNPIGQGSRFFQRMTKGTPGDEVGTTTTRHMVSFIDFYFHFLASKSLKSQTWTSPHHMHVLYIYSCYMKPVRDTNSEPGLPVVDLILLTSLFLSKFCLKNMINIIKQEGL